MTPEAQRIAIAEFCGWNIITIPFIPNRIKLGEKTCFTDEAKEQWKKTYPSTPYVKSLPDYLHDLNAMAEVEEHLHGEDWATYFDWLQHHGKATGVRATAGERAEGVLRTIGKWKEDA